MGSNARFLGNWGLQWVSVGSIVLVVGKAKVAKKAATADKKQKPLTN